MTVKALLVVAALLPVDTTKAVAAVATLIEMSCAPAHPRGRALFGLASWYGWDFHGLLMANGRRFYALGLTAASKELPLGTVVRVTHMGNGRSICVPITDRGPYVGLRILDLSLGAAKALHMVDSGLATVRIEIVSAPPSRVTPKRTPK